MSEVSLLLPSTTVLRPIPQFWARWAILELFHVVMIRVKLDKVAEKEDR